MDRIKNGYEPNEAPVFELISSHQNCVDLYRKMFNIRNEMNKNHSLSLGNLEFLIQALDLEKEYSQKLMEEFLERDVIKKLTYLMSPLRGAVHLVSFYLLNCLVLEFLNI